MAVASLVLGIIAVVLMWVPFVGAMLGALAAIFGAVSMGAPARPGQPDSSRGMAVAGLVMGAVALAFNLFLWGVINDWSDF
jgi:hypothetical protein